MFEIKHVVKFYKKNNYEIVYEYDALMVLGKEMWIYNYKEDILE
jgi:hypothetical protein